MSETAINARRKREELKAKGIDTQPVSVSNKLFVMMMF
jgi:hypothetical protein